jgi:hypothetical protein
MTFGLPFSGISTNPVIFLQQEHVTLTEGFFGAL